MKTRSSRKTISARGYNKQIFKRRDEAGHSLFLVCFTVLICGAVIFAAGFKLGRQYQDAVVVAGTDSATKLAETNTTDVKVPKD